MAFASASSFSIAAHSRSVVAVSVTVLTGGVPVLSLPVALLRAQPRTTVRIAIMTSRFIASSVYGNYN
jgi:hypothetical protein